MRVVFLEDVAGVANGGDIREVKNGFARNYLFPKSLAVPATHNALQGAKKLKGEADETRLKSLSDMKALAKELNGVRISVDMRAGTGGRLYGSVTNTMIAEQLSSVTGREIDRHAVAISDAFRELGLFDVKLRLHPEVEAQISVLVYATGTDPQVILAALTESEAEEDAEVSSSPDGDSEAAVAEESADAENEEKDS